VVKTVETVSLVAQEVGRGWSFFEESPKCLTEVIDAVPELVSDEVCQWFAMALFV